MRISRIDVVIVLLNDNWRLFRSQRHDDLDRGEATIDIVPLWLIEILGMRTVFLGIENSNVDGLAPPSIN